MTRKQPANQRNAGRGWRAEMQTGARISAGIGPATAAAAAATTRVDMARTLVCERRRVALRHRRRPSEETRTALAAIDRELAEFKIDIPAVEQARAARARLPGSSRPWPDPGTREGA